MDGLLLVVMDVTKYVCTSCCRSVAAVASKFLWRPSWSRWTAWTSVALGGLPGYELPRKRKESPEG